MSASEAGSTETKAGASWFDTTHWSVVLVAGRSDSAQANAALAKLCQTYWHPLYCYIRQSGHSPENAKDLTQGFFARLIEKDYLEAIDPEKGKFRTFLLIAVKRFLANEWDRANRQKRGGGHELLSLDEQDAEARYLIEPVDDNTPEKLFELSWATALLEQVMRCLAAEMAAEGKEKLFLELKVFLSGDKAGTSYPEIAGRLEMSEGTLRVNIHRFRQRYREVLRREIAHTVDTPGAVDDEIRRLFAALG
jgi:RNA polymerase sigma factor (sigma-70 family)